MRPLEIPERQNQRPTGVVKLRSQHETALVYQTADIILLNI